MKTGLKKLLRIGATFGIAALGLAQTVSAQSSNQFALQLGALQLGYISNSPASTTSLTPQQIANALIQGSLGLQATSTGAYPYVIGAVNLPPAQSDAFRQLVYTATVFALNSPAVYTNTTSLPVLVTNPISHTSFTSNTMAALSPVNTLPNSVFSTLANRVPNMSAGAVSNAVAASMAFKTNSSGVYIPVWGAGPTALQIQQAATNSTIRTAVNQTTYNTQLTNAITVAKKALTATTSTYISGTAQWAPVPTNGVVPGNTYLPNYSNTAIPNSNTVFQQPNLKGLANAAAAIAANAVNGLGNPNANQTANGPYGKTPTSVQQMTFGLISAASTTQAISTTPVVIQGTTYSGYALFGSVGATAFGVTTQVAGRNTTQWGGSSPFFTSLLQGVVNGAVQADATDVPAIARGVSQGFYANYLHYATGTPQTFAQFQSNNTTAIVTAFQTAGAQSSYNGITLTTIVNNAIQSLAVNLGNNNYAAIAGASGINLTNTITSSGVFSGVGTPVTDTLGL
jgi:hypothetical protein